MKLYGLVELDDFAVIVASKVGGEQFGAIRH